MTDPTLAAEDAGTRWTSPFCLLLCDHLRLALAATPEAPPRLLAGDCAGARRSLRHFTSAPAAATSTVDGQPVSASDAVAAAARILAASRQPLFGGLGCDVAGARALYRLACASGAICDAAQGARFMEGVKALQDRGGFGTTLGELRTRADLIVCVGGLPDGDAADLFARCGVGDASLLPQRHVVLLAGSPAEAGALAALGTLPGVTSEAIAPPGELFDAVAWLAARVERPGVGRPEPALDALATRLRAARYAVLVGQTERLPPHGALLIEAVGRIVAALNRTTRAAALWLGGGNGAGTVNEVFTWLSGLPLRSRAGPFGLQHEPLCFDAGRLLAEGAVDSLLWVSSFDPTSLPPPTRLPTVVLGHPALAACAAAPGRVFLPVATPGIGSAGHLFRADGGGVVLPLVPLYRDAHLSGLPAMLDEIARAVQALRAGAA